MNVMGEKSTNLKEGGNHQSNLHLFLEVVHVFKVLKFTTT